MSVNKLSGGSGTSENVRAGLSEHNCIAFRAWDRRLGWQSSRMKSSGDVGCDLALRGGGDIQTWSAKPQALTMVRPPMAKPMLLATQHPIKPLTQPPTRLATLLHHLQPLLNVPSDYLVLSILNQLTCTSATTPLTPCRSLSWWVPNSAVLPMPLPICPNNVSSPLKLTNPHCAPNQPQSYTNVLNHCVK